VVFLFRGREGIVWEGRRADRIARVGKTTAKTQTQRRAIKVCPLARRCVLNEGFRKLGELDGEPLTLVVFSPGILQPSWVTQHILR